jgi:branched-chain amino acid aminotransferase
MSDRKIWRDGAFVPWASATVHVLSHSMQRGSLVFDYLGVHATPRGPALFRLPEHIARFEGSLRTVGLEVPFSAEALERACCDTVRMNPDATAVKICAYLPSIEVDVVPMDGRIEVTIAAYDVKRDLIATKPHPTPRPETCRLKLDRQRKRIDAHLPPQAKAAANYLGVMMAKRAARAEGYDEIATLDEHGRLAEGPTTNLFLVDERGRLLTPSVDEILAGVTRDSILSLARGGRGDLFRARGVSLWDQRRRVAGARGGWGVGARRRARRRHPAGRNAFGKGGRRR